MTTAPDTARLTGGTMAKSDIQSQVILAVVTGAIITVEEAGIAEDELPAILYAREV